MMRLVRPGLLRSAGRAGKNSLRSVAVQRLASLAAALLLVAGVAVPAVAQRGRAGGGGRPAPMARPAAPMARPAAPMARPAAPMARPAAPMARPAPQMPMSRPAPQMQQMQRPQVQMPMNRPAPQMPMQRPAPQMQRPQVQMPMQRPNLPNMQRPGFAGGTPMNRPSLPFCGGGETVAHRYDPRSK